MRPFPARAAATTGEAWQNRIFEVAQAAAIPTGRAFGAIYVAFLDRINGPRAGWLLSSLDQAFVVHRLREAGDGVAENLTPVHAQRAGQVAAAAARGLPAMREALKVTSEPMTIDGVKAYMVTPENIPPDNRNRLLVHVHGGCYVNGAGEAATREATLMAGFGHFKVISVDYRMPPDHPFPAAVDDAVAVWRDLVARHDPSRMALFGTSTGGAPPASARRPSTARSSGASRTGQGLGRRSAK